METIKNRSFFIKNIQLKRRGTIVFTACCLFLSSCTPGPGSVHLQCGMAKPGGECGQAYLGS